MKILIVGGTLFVGRAIVDACVAAGHEVTLFNRGRTNPTLFPDVEKLVGDRDVDLSALSGRSFDAVIDPSAYFPRQIESLVAVLKQVGHYTFVSSTSVYASHTTVFEDETAALATVADPNDESSMADYGGFKALCESRLETMIPGQAHHVRSGLVVGPYDNTGRFSWWVQRIAQGGIVLAPEPGGQAIQVIDVRDLARWIIAAAEQGVAGPLNAAAPAGQATMRSLLDEMVAVLPAASTARLEWVDRGWLLDHGVRPWQELPLWLPPGRDGFMMRDTRRAHELGLVTRPVSDTIDATHEYLAAGGPLTVAKDHGVVAAAPGIAPEREQDLLAHWLEHNVGSAHSHGDGDGHSHAP